MNGDDGPSRGRRLGWLDLLIVWFLRGMTGGALVMFGLAMWQHTYAFAVAFLALFVALLALDP